jgi:hypothetical protein
VVREDEVDGAAVQVVGGPEEGLRDRGVLDVPPRPARTQFGLPERLAVLAALPQGEVTRVALLELSSIRDTESSGRRSVRPDSLPYAGNEARSKYQPSSSW